MSAVRMCDRCGRIFSENETGWASGSLGQKVTRDDGTVNTVSRQYDQCGECLGVQVRNEAERAAISSGVKPAIVDEVSRRVRQSEYDTGTDPRDMNETQFDLRRTRPARDNPQA